MVAATTVGPCRYLKTVSFLLRWSSWQHTLQQWFYFLLVLMFIFNCSMTSSGLSVVFQINKQIEENRRWTTFWRSASQTYSNEPFVKLTSSPSQFPSEERFKSILVCSFSAEVRDKKCFVLSLIADDRMADISLIEKLNICRRTVTLPADSFEVQEKLFGFYAMDRCDGQSRSSGHRRIVQWHSTEHHQ